MNLRSFFTVVFSLFIFSTSFASEIEIQSQCEWSKDYDNFLLRYKLNDKDASWYERGYKILQLQFTSQNDCEQVYQQLVQLREQDRAVLCGCYSSAYAPALFWGNLWLGFSRINCIKVNGSDEHDYILKTEEVVRNHWDKLTPKEIEKADLNNYFDKDEKDGQNFELCRKKIPAIIESNL